MGTVLHDLRYATRTLVRSPGFSVIAAVTRRATGIAPADALRHE